MSQGHEDTKRESIPGRAPNQALLRNSCRCGLISQPVSACSRAWQPASVGMAAHARGSSGDTPPPRCRERARAPGAGERPCGRSGWAVATRAWAGPRRPFPRREKAPGAPAARRTAWAARRQAVCSPVPRFHGAALPALAAGEIMRGGQTPARRSRGCHRAPGACRDPLSASMGGARDARFPWTAPRSPPVRRRMCARGVTAGAFGRCACGWRRGGAAAAAGTAPEERAQSAVE